MSDKITANDLIRNTKGVDPDYCFNGWSGICPIRYWPQVKNADGFLGLLEFRTIVPGFIINIIWHITVFPFVVIGCIQNNIYMESNINWAMNQTFLFDEESLKGINDETPPIKIT
jgi:hypothetical protein